MEVGCTSSKGRNFSSGSMQSEIHRLPTRVGWVVFYHVVWKKPAQLARQQTLDNLFFALDDYLTGTTLSGINRVWSQSLFVRIPVTWVFFWSLDKRLSSLAIISQNQRPFEFGRKRSIVQASLNQWRAPDCKCSLTSFCEVCITQRCVTSLAIVNSHFSWAGLT